MSGEMLRVKKLSEFAVLPSRGSKYAAGKFVQLNVCHTAHKLYMTNALAGFDLSSAYDIVVPARGKAIVKTDLAIAIPPNTYARIGKTLQLEKQSMLWFLTICMCTLAPRSGLAAKNFIDVGAGVVDYDYRGNVGVVLFNHAEQDFAISRGDRIAQLILERICMADMEEVEELPDTERGAGGFGSTGVAAADESATKKPRLEAEESK
jgi:dUTP pyrophosphatase